MPHGVINRETIGPNGRKYHKNRQAQKTKSVKVVVGRRVDGKTCGFSARSKRVRSDSWK